MIRRFPWLILAAALPVVALVACGGDDDDDAASPASTTAPTVGGGQAASFAATDLVATKKAPASMAADDPAWKSARATTVKTSVVVGSKATEAKDVSVQALYNDTDIWFRFEWADATQGNRAWQYDGTAWKKVASNEDRLALYWQITPVADFQTRGCAALCHSSDSEPVDKWYMIGPKPDDRLDNWHWKSERTNPTGQVDDKYLTGVLSDPNDIESANKGDAKESGGYSDNLNDQKNGPAKMKASGASTSLLVTEAVALDVSKLKAGDKVPRELLAPFVGSRGDIEAKGVWSNGKWAVVFHRKLDTGHADDVKFAVGQSYPFGLSVFNDLDAVNHTVSKGVYTLKFE